MVPMQSVVPVAGFAGAGAGEYAGAGGDAAPAACMAMVAGGYPCCHLEHRLCLETGCLVHDATNRLDL